MKLNDNNESEDDDDGDDDNDDDELLAEEELDRTLSCSSSRELSGILLLGDVFGMLLDLETLVFCGLVLSMCCLLGVLEELG